MQTTLYMLQEQSPIQMMSYVLQTKEGKLVVIDGGNKQDGAHLQDTLVRLGGPEPVVELWLLTHPHSDHVDARRPIRGFAIPLKKGRSFGWVPLSSVCFMCRRTSRCP